MINLLPPEAKQSIAYARQNRMLLKWSTVVGLSLVGLALVIGMGMLYINQSISDNKTLLANTQQQLKEQKLEETQKSAQEISNNVKLVVQVLSKQVLFSELLQQIGAAMPRDAVLTNLSINKLQGGIDLQASATDYQSASQVQVNLQDSKNKIFTKADLINVQCSATAEVTKYPCTVTVRAQFSADNPFLLLSKSKQGTTR